MFTVVLVRAKELCLTMLQKTEVVKKLTEDHQVHRGSRFSLSDKAVVRSELLWVMDKAVVGSRDFP